MSINSEAGDTLWHTGFQIGQTVHLVQIQKEKKQKNSTFPSRKQQLVPDVVHFLVNTWGTASKMNAGEVCMSSGVCAGLSNQTVYCAKNDGHACKSLC